MTSDVSRGHPTRRIHRAGAVALVFAALAIGVFAGCGGGGGTSTSQGAATSPSTTSSSSTTTTGAGTSTTATTTGGGTTTSAEPGTTVREGLEAVLLSGDPAKACGASYVTEDYLKQAYGGKQGCVKAQRPSAAAQGLGDISVKTQANDVVVSVRPTGGLYDGEKITLSFVKEDGDWKLDRLSSNAPVGP